MAIFSPTDYHAPCQDCGFQLFLPIAETETAVLGLYNDGRFVGRCILAMKEHYDSMVDVPTSYMNAFIEDSKAVMEKLNLLSGVSRVNFAILGNAVSHVHAHLIPRYPENEQYPHKSPWNDQRELSSLSDDDTKALVKYIHTLLIPN